MVKDTELIKEQILRRMGEIMSLMYEMYQAETVGAESPEDNAEERDKLYREHKFLEGKYNMIVKSKKEGK